MATENGLQLPPELSKLHIGMSQYGRQGVAILDRDYPQEPKVQEKPQLIDFSALVRQHFNEMFPRSNPFFRSTARLVLNGVNIPQIAENEGMSLVQARDCVRSIVNKLELTIINPAGLYRLKTFATPDLPYDSLVKAAKVGNVKSLKFRRVTWTNQEEIDQYSASRLNRASKGDEELLQQGYILAYNAKLSKTDYMALLDVWSNCVRKDGRVYVHKTTLEKFKKERKGKRQGKWA